MLGAPQKLSLFLFASSCLGVAVWAFYRSGSSLPEGFALVAFAIPLVLGFFLGTLPALGGAIAILALNVTVHSSIHASLEEPWLALYSSLLLLSVCIGVTTDLKRKLKEETSRLEKLERAFEEQHAALLQAAKMSSLGEMAAALAHEISNPLFVIEGRSRQLKREMEQNPIALDSMKTYVNNIETMSYRINRIVHSLRSFSRRGERDAFTSVKVKTLFDETFVLCMERFKKMEVELTINAIPDTLEIECRETQISQVLLNLLNNAYDAVSELEEQWVRIDVESLDNALRITLTDSGKGISPELYEKIFQPFYTTKAQGRGTGLGLSISLGIIREHFGSLTLDTSHPHTCFVLTLPFKHSEPAAEDLQASA